MVSLGWASPAGAWAPSGHMQIALLAYDALEMTFREYRVRRDPNCAVCGDHPSIQHPEDLACACAAMRASAISAC